MVFVEVNYDELKRIKKEQNKNLKKFVEKFLESGNYCVEVSDDEKLYNNNNDLRNVLAKCIKREGFNVKAFMVNGKVYLRRIYE
jgi:hypothetical protein